MNIKCDYSQPNQWKCYVLLKILTIYLIKCFFPTLCQLSSQWKDNLEQRVPVALERGEEEVLTWPAQFSSRMCFYLLGKISVHLLITNQISFPHTLQCKLHEDKDSCHTWYLVGTQYFTNEHLNKAS
jgi:hypothetical protein